MKTITVNTSKTYDIVIGTGILEEAGSYVRKTCGGQKAVIVMDDNVAVLYEKRMTDTLVKSGYCVSQYVFPHGEASKNTETFLSLVNFLAENKLSRTDIVIALGGGVIGDLAGFAAACYMRGIRFVQIPTTLTAAVDSSVGGKTAVNLAAGKNLLGAFYQPDLVFCDVSLLSTLTHDVFNDGCAEVIKYGIIADNKLFEALKTPVHTQLEDVIARCIEIKRDIVSEDEFENGKRKLLNFGHTIGHAIELLSEYRTAHGHAVAAGMAVEARAAVRMGICEACYMRDISDMLRRYDLPINTSYSADKIMNACLSDKKRDGESLTMVFPVEIGKCVLKKIPVSELEAVIRLGSDPKGDVK
ncbi:MAG: 3-dehydroquinate synthase [Alphaproteobacteria bacterium]|nr:3-dehydroquinate synthase [Alphaproteobacteria bacterium]MCL2504758.1 3-dehydroquinate synthase [Alphaproteobacteria bacterium]